MEELFCILQTLGHISPGKLPRLTTMVELKKKKKKKERIKEPSGKYTLPPGLQSQIKKPNPILLGLREYRHPSAHCARNRLREYRHPQHTVMVVGRHRTPTAVCQYPVGLGTRTQGPQLGFTCGGRPSSSQAGMFLTSIFSI